jgi:hypothetical protein
MPGSRGLLSRDIPVTTLRRAAPSPAGRPYNFPWVPVPADAGHVEAVILLDDARLLAAGLRLTIVLEARGPWPGGPRHVASVVWDSGPGNRLLAGDDPVPRPGSGWTTLPPGTTDVRPRLDAALTDGTQTVDLDVVMTTGS